MRKTSFKSLHDNRKKFLEENKCKDHVVISGTNNVLISAPHGVSQVRLGRLKYQEIGSLTTALYLHKATNSYLIAKTKNNNDDANFDECCRYRDSIDRLVDSGVIKYLIDMHGLGAHRKCDINLGVNLGKNIETNVKLLDNLKRALKNAGFCVVIDQPFMAGGITISGGMKLRHPELWTIQIEINCAITNRPENFEKYSKLLCVLREWIDGLE